MIVRKLTKAGVEIIYFDGFSINPRRLSHYNWSPRGQKSFVQIKAKDEAMSFIVAISEARIYGWVAVEGNTDAKVVVYFIKELIAKRSVYQGDSDVNFVLACDNASNQTGV